MSLAASGRGCERPSTPSRTISTSTTRDIVRIGSLPGGMSFAITSASESTSRWRAGPGPAPAGSGSSEPGPRPPIRRSLTFSTSVASTSLPLYLARDVLEGRADDLVIDRVTRGAAVLAQHLVRRHRRLGLRRSRAGAAGAAALRLASAGVAVALPPGSHDVVGTTVGTAWALMYATSIHTPSVPMTPPYAGIPFGRP